MSMAIPSRTAEEFEKALIKISEKVGEQFRSWRDVAWALYVWASTRQNSTMRREGEATRY
jgi:3-methyladenine DNA glycosylase/8-oxoguanine DNA glycosylase